VHAALLRPSAPRHGRAAEAADSADGRSAPGSAATGNRPKHPASRGSAPLRCLIVDDSPEFLEAARQLLEHEGIDVVGVASSGAEALRLAEVLRPDITLVDIDLGDEDGIALTRSLAGSPGQPAGKLILISTHAADEFADLILTSPVVGFIPKSMLSGDSIRSLSGADGEREI